MSETSRAKPPRGSVRANCATGPLWEKVSPKATDEGCSSGVRRWRSLEHPSSVSALRADPPSPTRGEGKG
ncbi:hypothetical protein EJ067_02380 [Mesorhizobium sp. M1D.F.Ca.ET.043.01.1.1]|nr:hypothetical protein EJ067_02380 [Mesorhizobium sp. M1D.F.Ca.ET.043.01.1.1]